MSAGTIERVAAGEREHLAYFVLQSKSFTRRPPIEPALSAQADIGGRVEDFLRALDRPSRDARIRYYQRSMPKRDRTKAYLLGAHAEASQFLAGRDYQRRGHSSDTRLASSFTVWNALSVLKQTAQGARVTRALIVGPGADFAPRTDFDDTPPQSYQPLLLANSLRAMKLSPPDVRIDCMDANPRVIETVRASAKKITLPEERGGEEFEQWKRNLKIEPANIEAFQGDILAQKTDCQYDLIVITNLLLYFDSRDTARAVANLKGMLREGGYLIHNDERPETERLLSEAGLKTIQARRILIAQGRKAPLYDMFSIVRK